MISSGTTAKSTSGDGLTALCASTGVDTLAEANVINTGTAPGFATIDGVTFLYVPGAVNNGTQTVPSSRRIPVRHLPGVVNLRIARVNGGSDMSGVYGDIT